MAFPDLPSPSILTAALLNRLLRQQAWARAHLRPYAGKRVCVQMAGWALALRIQEDGLVQPASAPAPSSADVVLTLAQDNLAAALEAAGTRDLSRLTALVHVEGEAALAQAVLALAQNLRWDPEDELAQRVGDRAAAAIVGTLKDAGQGMRKAGRHLAENVAEYLSHENAVLLARAPFADWAAQVQGLSQRLAELEAVAAQLAAKQLAANPSRYCATPKSESPPC